MANKNELTYEGIESPYNSLMERDSDNAFDIKAASSDDNSSQANDGSATNGSASAPIDGKKLDSIWLNSWIKSRNYKPKTQGFMIDGASGYIECMKLYVGTGGIIGGTLDIPDNTSANSWHVDSLGNMWSGAVSFAAARFSVTNSGALKATSATITGAITASAGSSIATSYLSGNIGLANTNIAAQGWTSTIAFSSTDYRVVTWSSGTITTAAGTSYSINAGNTGNMGATTYIYLNIDVSTTVLQTTTTASTAVGSNKILICVANNVTSPKLAEFQVFGGRGGISKLITANVIAANTITGNEIAANTITASKIASNTITATQINSGYVYAGTIDADQINAGTFTGFTIQTDSSGDRIVLSNSTNDMTVYDSSGIKRININQENLKFYNTGGSEVGKIYTTGGDTGITVATNNSAINSYLTLKTNNGVISFQPNGTSVGYVNTTGYHSVSGGYGVYSEFFGVEKMIRMTPQDSLPFSDTADGNFFLASDDYTNVSYRNKLIVRINGSWYSLDMTAVVDD